MICIYSAWFSVELATWKTTLSLHTPFFLAFFWESLICFGGWSCLSQDVAWYPSQGGERGPEGYLAWSFFFFRLDLWPSMALIHTDLQMIPKPKAFQLHLNSPISHPSCFYIFLLLHQGEILSYDLSGKPRAEPHRIRAAKAKARVNKFAADVVSYIEVTRETQKVGYLDVI